MSIPSTLDRNFGGRGEAFALELIASTGKYGFIGINGGICFVFKPGIK